MYKRFSTSEYKRFQKNKRKKYAKKLRRKNKEYTGKYSGSATFVPLKKVVLKPEVYAPADFRLLDNPETCIKFFQELRSESSMNRVWDKKYVRMNLKAVNQIDYASISILTAINDNMGAVGIGVQGNTPDHSVCKISLIESGYFDHVRTLEGKKFPKYYGKSGMIYFEKGQKYLKEPDHIRISNLVKDVLIHLDGNEQQRLPLKTIILEICGNVIEWSGPENRLWSFGVKYENDKVLFTVADVGKGILRTLHRKYRHIFLDRIIFRDNLDILIRAFKQKYGSTSQEENRNKGLPSVRNAFEQGKIKNLKVLTNDVILHFDKANNSKVLKGIKFDGTFYYWELNRECLKNIA